MNVQLSEIQHDVHIHVSQIGVKNVCYNMTQSPSFPKAKTTQLRKGTSNRTM